MKEASITEQLLNFVQSYDATYRIYLQHEVGIQLFIINSLTLNLFLIIHIKWEEHMNYRYSYSIVVQNVG